MKTLKKLFTLLIAMVMTMGMSLTVFAEDDPEPTQGTITVYNTSATVGQYQQKDDGTLKYDSAKEKYVPITAEEEDEIAASDRYAYVQVTNTYKAYRIFQASPSQSGDDQTKPTTTWGGTNGNKVSYTATAAQVNVLKDEGQVLPTDAGGFVTGVNGCFKFTLAASGVYIVELVEDKTAANVAAYFNANISTLTATTNATIFPATTLTVADEKASATVDYGYYFVTSSNGSVVSVDTTNNNVVINDKNTYGDPFNPGDDDDPSDNDLKNITEINGEEIDIDHDNTSASIGDILTFKIQNNTSNFVVKEGTSKKVSYVYVNDKIGTGLTYKEGTFGGKEYTFTVKVGDTTLGKADEPIYVQGATKQYYIVEKDADDQGDAFTVVIPWLDENGDPVFEDNAVVTVTYHAQLNELVEEVAGQTPGDNASNKADVKYDLVDPDTKPDPDPDTPPTPPTPGQGGSNTGVKEDEVKVFVYAIAIQKYDGADQHALEGAKFEVKLGNTVIGAVPETVNGKVTRYMYNSTNTDQTTGYTTEFVTNADGQIIIYGVKEGTYTVTETVAPKGYNLMDGTTDIEATVAEEKVTTQSITITKYYEQDNNGDYKKVAGVDGAPDTFVLITADDGDVAAENRYKETKEETDYSQPVEISRTTENVAYAAIENNAGTELPSTGGIGTTLFYTVGTILVLGAGILLVTKKRLDA